MKIEIKSRYSNTVLFAHGCDGNSAKTTLLEAVKAGADLRGANLGGADLGGADLGGANLRNADLSGADLGGADLGGADLRGANLGGADLRGANLGGADLRGANLGGAGLSGAGLSDIRSLWGAVGNMSEIKAIQCDLWPVTYTAGKMQIGCQFHTLAEWWAFSDSEIERMDSKALAWWAVWKPILQEIVEVSPATTGKTKGA